MKENLIKYYSLIIMFIYTLINIVFKSFMVYGLLYYILMTIFIFVNMSILINNKEKIKYKEILVIFFFVFGLWWSKNGLHFIFSLLSIIIIIVTNFKEKIIKVLTAIIVYIIILLNFGSVVLLIGLTCRGLSPDYKETLIYKNQHYYCNNNYEVFSFSAGAGDSYHFEIRKKHNILNINGIIQIVYNYEKIITKDEFDKYKIEHKCELKGDINGLKENIKLD